MPVVASYFAPLEQMVYLQYVFAIIFLMTLGAVAAKTGGSHVGTAMLRISFWGTVAMGVTALIGYLFGVSLA